MSPTSAVPAPPASASSTGPQLRLAPPPAPAAWRGLLALDEGGRDTLGLAGYLLAFVCLQVALLHAAATPRVVGRAQAILHHPRLLAGAVVGLLVWGWFRLVRAARADEGPWPLQAARAVVFFAAFVVTSGPGWPGPAGDRPIWAGAILAETLLSFRPTRTWAVGAGLAAGLIAWLLIG